MTPARLPAESLPSTELFYGAYRTSSATSAKHEAVVSERESLIGQSSPLYMPSNIGKRASMSRHLHETATQHAAAIICDLGIRGALIPNRLIL